MINLVKKLINNFLSLFNLKLTKLSDFVVLNRSISELDPLIEDDFKKIYKKIEKNFGKADPVPAFTVFKSLKYIIDNKIHGDLVECGVYKGRMIATMIETLSFYGVKDKKIYLYDTFEGMTNNTEFDKHIFENENKDIKLKKGDNFCDIDEVKDNLKNFEYDEDKIVFVKGDVMKTLKENNVPNNISLLRLDTDFYDSSLVELECLYPKVNMSGFIIYDDYGHWVGQKKATDEYFEKRKLKPFFVRTSRKERLEIKKLLVQENS